MGNFVLSSAHGSPLGGYRTTPTADDTDRGYTGHLHTDYIKLVYMNARWYSPGIGKFASADTIVPNLANPQSFNRYSYVYNRPLNLTDPSGHDPAHCADQYESQGDPACNHSYPSLIDFTADNNAEWTQEEMLMIIQAANDVANQMADTVNAGRAIEDRISPKQTFSRVFGGSVEAHKTSQGCTVATDCVAWASLTESLLTFTQLTNPHLFVHELFHTFDLVILENDANQTLFNEQNTNGAFPNRPNLTGESRLQWGFAGGNFSDWQKSRSGISGEEFADMGIGWTYGQWQRDADGLTVDGQARADFMDAHMPGWILDAIGE